MSVLIKGMEMPTSCSECACCGYYGKGDHVCDITGKDVVYELSLEKRRDDCPLVELPPHGRLIDADALMENVKTVDYIYRKVLRWLIDHASTIIEAENPFFESLKAGLEQAINGDVRETIIEEEGEA